jgi:hypothetical protein
MLPTSVFHRDSIMHQMFVRIIRILDIVDLEIPVFSCTIGLIISPDGK